MASLNQYSGTLDRRLAGHLLRRTTFNISPTRIDAFTGMSVSQAVDALFNAPALQVPQGPISYQNNQPWLTLNVASGFGSEFDNNARYTVWGWMLHEMLHDTSIRHKMVLFLHSCFTLQLGFTDRDYVHFAYLQLLQHYALGNLKTLAKKVTVDNRMLTFLDNRYNTKYSPNENYAREFLELFTVQKGPLIGPGDYTTYTESDIGQAARVFTGFTTSTTETDPETGFRRGRARFSEHDLGDKTFSAAMGGVTITAATSEQDMFRELSDFVDMIFSQLATAESFVRRMYRFFVRESITTEIETDIITPLAQDLLNDNFDVVNALKRLLKSEHFYDADDADATDEIIGAKVKSPMELLLQGVSFFGLETFIPDPVNFTEEHYMDFYKDFVMQDILDRSKMPFFEPPSVLGYDAYAQAPGYSNFWFDGSTLITRYSVPETLFEGKRTRGGNIRISDFIADLPAFVAANFANPSSANDVVTQLLEYLLPEFPSPERFDYFMGVFLADLSPINWYFEWLNYANTNDGSAVAIPLRDLLTRVVASPEYQLF
ncbi:MAG: DUF1800 family protein [Bacteroidota bacterium]